MTRTQRFIRRFPPALLTMIFSVGFFVAAGVLDTLRMAVGSILAVMFVPIQLFVMLYTADSLDESIKNFEEKNLIGDRTCERCKSELK